MSERYIPPLENETPLTSVARIESAPDSSPDSSRQFSHAIEQRGHVRSSRRFAGRLLAGGAVAGAILMGPQAVDEVNDRQSAAVKTEAAEVAERPGSRVLQTAQFNAVKELFTDENGDYDYEAAKKMMDEAAIRTKGIDWQLPVTEFIDADQATIGPDGKTVELNGQSYSFAQVQAKEGHLYILAANTVKQDNLLAEDQVDMVKPMLMGGARFRDDVDSEELRDEAYSNTRGNIDQSFDFWNGEHGKIIVGSARSDEQNILLSKR